MSTLVLLVENDPGELTRLGAALEGAGYSVRRAPDAEWALQDLEVARPAGAVIDTELPVMSGLMLLGQIREDERNDPECGTLPVIMISEKASMEDRAAALSLGATDYVTKPFLETELLMRLERALPLRAAGGSGAAGDRSPGPAPRGDGAAGPAKAAGPPTVLVAEDVMVLRRLIVATIESLGCRVIQAADGHEAWSLLSKKDFDLVVMDVLMPGLTGIEVLERIRADERTKDVPVILCTTRSYSSEVRTAAKLGIKDYIIKPFKPEVLMAKVRAVLASMPK